MRLPRSNEVRRRPPLGEVRTEQSRTSEFDCRNVRLALSVQPCCTWCSGAGTDVGGGGEGGGGEGDSVYGGIMHALFCGQVGEGLT